MNYTPEEVAKLLANRPNQPHYIAALIAECVATERERCAKLCEQEICACCWDDDAQAAAEHLAAEIRKGPNA